MIDPAHFRADVARLARAAPGAFRDDAVFRTAAIGALLALLFLLGRMGGKPDAVPAPPPPPAALGRSYGQGAAPAAADGPQPNAGAPIAPSRSLVGVVVQPDALTPADRFGTLKAANRTRKDTDARP